MALKKNKAAAPAIANLAPAPATSAPVFIELNPADVLADDNSRYRQNPERLQALMDSIVELGGVQTPIQVSKIENVNGHSHRLVAGFYRHAAVTKLNKKGGSYTLPAMVVSPADELDRIKRQLSENNDRENLSPIDKAIGMQKMFALGASKMDVRKAFPAVGGRKGASATSIEPASNSTVNMHLSFLKFPADVQEMIHTSELPIGAAYELSLYNEDKWPAIIERAKKDRASEQDKADKREANFLAAERKAEEAASAAEAEQKELDEAKEAIVTTAAVLDTATTAASTAHIATLKPGLPKEEKETLKEAYKAAEAALKEAQKAASDAAKELAKLDGTSAAASDAAKTAKQQLKEAREAAGTAPAGDAKKPKGGVTQRNVAQAAAAIGAGKSTASAGPTKAKFNQTQMWEYINDLALPSGSELADRRVKAVGEAIRNHFLGVVSRAECGKMLRAAVVLK